MKRILLLLVLALATVASAEDFDQAAYRSADLAEVAAMQKEEIGPESVTYWLDAAHPKYAATVSYTGRSRLIDAGIESLILRWVKAMGHPDRYNEMFKIEVEVRHGLGTYWMPIQDSLVPPWREEMSEGDRAEVQVLLLGAYERAPVFTIAGFERRGENPLKKAAHE